MDAVRRKQFSEAVKRGPAQIGLGRYQQVGSAPAPANGVARPVPSQNVRTAVVAIPDPLDPKARIQATVNRAVDVLEIERSHNRISEAAYRVGRSIQATYENVRESDGLANERVDKSTTPDQGMVVALFNAKERVVLDAYLRRMVGEIGARQLRAVLVEGLTFEQMAAQRGQGSRHGGSYAGTRFRWMLEDLAESWAAKG